MPYKRTPLRLDTRLANCAHELRMVIDLLANPTTGDLTFTQRSQLETFIANPSILLHLRAMGIRDSLDDLQMLRLEIFDQPAPWTPDIADQAPAPDVDPCGDVLAFHLPRSRLPSDAVPGKVALLELQFDDFGATAHCMRQLHHGTFANAVTLLYNDTGAWGLGVLLGSTVYAHSLLKEAVIYPIHIISLPAAPIAMTLPFYQERNRRYPAEADVFMADLQSTLRVLGVGPLMEDMLTPVLKEHERNLTVLQRIVAAAPEEYKSLLHEWTTASGPQELKSLH